MNAAAPDRSTQSGSPYALLVFLCIVGVGSFLRLYDLDARIMHGDEANQAIRTAILLESGVYEYDPEEFHGPTLYYAGAALSKLAGHESRADMTETVLRLVPAMAGIATILLLWLLRGALGIPATLFAALFLSLSPALTFYSGYYIQESLLAAFTLAAIAFGWKLETEPRAVWALLTGLSIGLMHATKETAIVAWIAIIGAGLITFALYGRQSFSKRDTKQLAVHSAIAILSAIAISTILYSSFGTNPKGILDSLTTYTHYLDRGNRPQLHQHPWHFYLHRLAWYHKGPGPTWTEAFILIAAAIGAITSLASLRGRNSETPSPYPLFYTLFAFLMLFAYCLISYKTPWNLVQFLVPLCILGGAGLASLWSAAKTRRAKTVFVLLIAAASAHLGYLNYQANHPYASSPYNPYVYGHTSSGLRKTLDLIDGLAAVHPDGEGMRIAVIQTNADYWPLPWYFRSYERAGYWSGLPDPLPSADIIIAGSSLNGQLSAMLESTHTHQIVALRPGVLRTAYIDRALMKRYMMER